MQLTFLQGEVPLTKTYTKIAEGKYRGSSYPSVYLVTSHVEEITTVSDLATALRSHSAAGHCLYTSNLTKPLNREPRAKMAIKDEQPQWLVLDLDGVNFIDSEEFVRKVLPAEFSDVSYVEQHSPSSGIKPGLRSHLYFLLFRGEDRRVLSDWLKSLNLATGPLRDQVTLSRKQMALSWPLDIVANNKARPIYIAPPECEGFDDPLKERIRVVEKGSECAYFDFAKTAPPSLLRHQQRELIDYLRAAAGLHVSKKQEIYTYNADGKEFLIKELTEPGRVTDWIEDNDRFMRCNVDGGDSWAYYYHRDHPTWLHNFKGEPALHLASLDPEHWNKIALPWAEGLKEKTVRPFVFRDMISDKYYAGIRQEGVILEQPLIISSRDRVEDFFVTRGNTSPPANIESWTREFDPTLDRQWNPDDRIFNFWRPTKYQKNALVRTNPPETIDYILRHVTGDDEESYDRLTNWLAYIYQTRKKTGTAWVLHGVPGTGKGLLYNYIIRPIFGHDYCQTKQIRDLRSNFNGWMEHALFINVDETNTNDAGREESAVIEALKMWITDPIISIEAKNQNARMANSFSNFIFTSNDFGALPIQQGDRRFNVAPRQEQRIALDDTCLEAIGSELQHFAGFLKGYNVVESLATESLENEAKSTLREVARTSIDDFIYAAMQGDLEYFVDGTYEPTSQYQEQAEFRQAVSEWLEDARNRRPSYISRQQLRAAYVIICSDRSMRANKFVKLMSKRGAPVQKHRMNGELFRGWKVEWKLSPEAAVKFKAHLKLVPTDSEIEENIKNEINDGSEG